MIYEKGCATIVMLTKVREGGRIKCHCYWPQSGAETYGRFQVILHATNEYQDYILRELKIVDTRVSQLVSAIHWVITYVEKCAELAFW